MPCRCGGATRRRRSSSSPSPPPPSGRGSPSRSCARTRQARPGAPPDTCFICCRASPAPRSSPRSGKPPPAPSPNASRAHPSPPSRERGRGARGRRPCARGARAGSRKSPRPSSRGERCAESSPRGPRGRRGRGSFPARVSASVSRPRTAPPRWRSWPAARTGTSSVMSSVSIRRRSPKRRLRSPPRSWGRSPTTSFDALVGTPRRERGGVTSPPPRDALWTASPGRTRPASPASSGSGAGAWSGTWRAWRRGSGAGRVSAPGGGSTGRKRRSPSPPRRPFRRFTGGSTGSTAVPRGKPG